MEYKSIYFIVYFYDKRAFKDREGNTIEANRSLPMQGSVNFEDLHKFFDSPKDFIGNILHGEGATKNPNQIVKHILMQDRKGNRRGSWTLGEYFIDFPLRRLMSYLSGNTLMQVENMANKLHHKQQLTFEESKLLSELLHKHSVPHHANAFKIITQKAQGNG
jgi:hypothetical protein